MVDSKSNLWNFLWKINTLGNSVDHVNIRLIFLRWYLWSVVSAHHECKPIWTPISCKSPISLNVDDLRIKKTKNDTWVLHNSFPLILAFPHLLQPDILKINRPVGIKLLLPLLEQLLEHEYLVIANFSLWIYLSQLSICDISITLLRLWLLLNRFIVLTKVFL